MTREDIIALTDALEHAVNAAVRATLTGRLAVRSVARIADKVMTAAENALADETL